jgi:hypothetical protein
MFKRGRKTPSLSAQSSRKWRFFQPMVELLENRNLPSLANPISGSIGGEPTGPRMADLNGDGIPDLVTVDPSANTVSIMLGNGNGTFAKPIIYPAGLGADAVAIGDLNGDHKPDLIVADYGGSGAANSGGVSVLLGNGDGSFQPAVFTPTGSQPLVIIPRDFNGDGKLDIALASDTLINFTTAGTVDILLGNGTGGFAAPAHYPLGNLPNSMAAGDFYGTGKIDLAVAGAGASSLSLVHGLGNGTFQAAINFSLPGVTPVSLTSSDFNRDSRTDLAMIDSITGLVAVSLSNGNGTFKAPVAYNLGPATRVVAADVTSDSIADLITVGGDINGTVTLAAGQGDGTFQPPVQYPAGVASPDSLALGNLTASGQIGLIPVSSSTGAFGVLLNLPPAKLQFSSASYSVSESAGSETITVTNSGSSGTVTVNYATSDGSARAGVNYKAVSGSLTWANGDSSAKTFTIPIIDDGKPGNNMSINLTLSSPGGSATLGSPSTAVVLVLNNHFRQAKLVGEAAESGQWWLAKPTATGASSTLQGYWAPTSGGPTWVNVTTGDFNGDGHTDIIGQVQQNGQWWVSLSTANGFYTTPWGAWDANFTWTNFHVGDFSGDGKDDIVAMNAATGQWMVGTSTGTSFKSSVWGKWSTAVTWVDVMVGDLNGNGKLDIVGRARQYGQWWAAMSTGSAFQNALWGTWSPDSASLTWVDVHIGDLTGNGKADIVGRVLQTGDWWAGISTGSAFNNVLWGHWSTAVTWTNVMLGDVTGDGKMDLVGRVAQSGQWWVGLSTGSNMVNNLWGSWSTMVTWVNVQLGDFNADGRMDVIGQIQGTGQFWLGTSTGSHFVNSLFTTWSNQVTWINVFAGTFA